MEAGLDAVMTPAVVVAPDTPMSVVLSTMRRSKMHGVVVGDSRKVEGVIDDRTLRDFTQPASTTKAENVCIKVPLIDADAATPQDIALAFLNSTTRIIPVRSKGKIVGALTRSQVLALFSGATVFAGKRAGEFASHSNALIGEGAQVSQARALMRALGVHHLAVVDGSQRVVGSLSSHDLATKISPYAHETFRGSSRMPTRMSDVSREEVKYVSNPAPVLVQANASLKEAVKLFAEKNVTALLVLDGARFSGLLTVRDCLSATIAPAAEKVYIFGLAESEKTMSRSMYEYANSFFAKWSRKGEADALMLHVKSFPEGKKRRYQVKARACVGRSVVATTTPDKGGDTHWDAFSAIKEVLGELDRRLSDSVHSKVHGSRIRMTQRDRRESLEERA